MRVPVLGVVAALVVLAGVGGWMTGRAQGEQRETAASSMAAEVLEVKGKEYEFIPSYLEVKQGTLVTIRFTNVGTMKHEFELEGYNLEIKPIPPNTTSEITFVADKPGRFEYACHVDDHYQKGMKGVLVVR